MILWKFESHPLRHLPKETGVEIAPSTQDFWETLQFPRSCQRILSPTSGLLQQMRSPWICVLCDPAIGHFQRGRFACAFGIENN
jgi:hypothetical protein